MEILGIVTAVALSLVPNLKSLLDSVAYRNRARGDAEVIRAERANEVPQLPSGMPEETASEREGEWLSRM